MSRWLALKWKARHHAATLVGDTRSYFGLLYGCVLAVWVAYVSHRLTHVPPGGFCADAPPNWLSTMGENVSALPVEVEFGGARLRRAARAFARQRAALRSLRSVARRSSAGSARARSPRARRSPQAGCAS